MKTRPGKQSWPVAKRSSRPAASNPPRTLEAPGTEPEATRVPRSYHPLQHDDLGSQISAHGKNVDQPQSEYNVIQAKDDAPGVQRGFVGGVQPAGEGEHICGTPTRHSKVSVYTHEGCQNNKKQLQP